MSNNVNIKTITINILLNNPNDEINRKTILVEIDDIITANELIKLSIIKFNEDLQDENKSITFDLDLRHYSLRVSKKNGQPNLDYPEIGKDNIIIRTGMERFTITYSKIAIKSTFISRNSLNPNNQKCNRCLIL